jgi:uncharacterized HAD superfamily protein
MEMKTRRRRQVAIDVDGVIFNTPELVRRDVNAANKTNVGYHDMRSYPLFSSFPGSTPGQIGKAFDRLWIEEPHRMELLDPQIPAILNSLRETETLGLNIVTCAANGLAVACSNIKAQLKKHGIVYDGIYHVRAIHQKAMLEMDIHIEDDPKITWHTKAHVILYPNPWILQHIEDRKAKRKGNFLQASEIIEYPDPNTIAPRRKDAKGLILLARDWQHIKELLMTEAIRS